MQKVYRTKLPADELEIWAETLKDYSFQEFDKAMKHLVANPPKYELEDGTVQVWRGMPKLPDVIDVMLDLRAKAVQEAQQRERDARAAEFRELEKRRAGHPEEFFGWADVVKAVSEKLPEVANNLDPARPSVPLKTWPQEPQGLNERQTELRRQKMKSDYQAYLSQQEKAGKP